MLRQFEKTNGRRLIIDMAEVNALDELDDGRVGIQVGGDVRTIKAPFDEVHTAWLDSREGSETARRLTEDSNTRSRVAAG